MESAIGTLLQAIGDYGPLVVSLVVLKQQRILFDHHTRLTKIETKLEK